MNKLFKFAFNIYLRHFIAVFISVIMIIPFYALASGQQYLFSGITGVLYFALLYCGGWKFGFRDARKIPGFAPDKFLPVKASLLAMILPVLLIMLYAFFPDIWHSNMPFMQGDVEFFIKGCYIKGTPDCLYRLYQLPLAGFIPSQNLLGYIITLIFEPLIVFIGYIVGLKRFSIMEYISAKIIFSSDPSGKNKKEDKLRR